MSNLKINNCEYTTNYILICYNLHIRGHWRINDTKCFK